MGAGDVEQAADTHRFGKAYDNSHGQLGSRPGATRQPLPVLGAQVHLWSVGSGRPPIPTTGWRRQTVLVVPGKRLDRRVQVVVVAGLVAKERQAGC